MVLIFAGVPVNVTFPLMVPANSEAELASRAITAVTRN
jgi:hypothetical protein